MAPSSRRKIKQIQRAKALSREERLQEILQDRTERLAARSDAGAAPAVEAPRVLVCQAGPERIGIRIEAVAEILPFQAFMPIPDGPPALVGVFGRGGRLVSVIDLGLALGLEAGTTEQDDWHLVLLRRDNPQIALRVDRAQDVAPITPLLGEESGGFRAEAVTGYAQVQSTLSDENPVGRGGILSLLDVDRLLRPYLPSSSVSGV
jgi:purine-binding chemotaxis protein CheW